MTKEECYKILNVKPDATAEQIKISYKKLIKKYHPDTYKGDKNFATEKTMQVVSAFKFLNKNNVSKPIRKQNNNQNKKQTIKTKPQKAETVKPQNEKIINKKNITKPKFPIKAIEGDVIVIVVLSIILIVLLVIFANL